MSSTPSNPPRGSKPFSMYDHFYEGDDIKADIQKDYNYWGDLAEIFINNEGSIVHKWHHYFPIYERYFSKYRGTNFRFLEIGVSEGGSLRMWRRYFGENATIFGIDIDPDCAQYDGESGQVRIGSQADPEFLLKVIEEMGGVDVILDDGSHHMQHIPVSLKTLYPKLSMGGLYMIEDLHTAYWPGWGGGVDHPDNFFNLLRELIDDQHQWYHRAEIKHPNLSKDISAIGVYDSIVVFEKNEVLRPVHSKIGKPSAKTALPPKR